MCEVIYLYDGTFDGFLSCVFEAYLRREAPLSIQWEEEAQPSLFDTRPVPTDPARADRVYRKLQAVSPYGLNLVCKCFLTCLSDREIHMFRLIAKLLKEGPGFLSNLSDETLYPVAYAVRKLNTEAHLLKGFLRFSDLGGVLAAEMEPKNRVLPLLRAHFCARYQEEAFFIYDRTHKEALFYAGGRCELGPLDEFRMAPPDGAEAAYRRLWKRFYDTIAIRERENPRKRMSSMPKRYWGVMTEFQDEDYFQAAEGREKKKPGEPSRELPQGTASAP
ncbi:MAG: TIGR03915 family putative DNA repair protein [Oscillibacter sp.]|nr:TIGR03915 family putative DNA repair protein [Oscillibacter sp.]